MQFIKPEERTIWYSKLHDIC